MFLSRSLSHYYQGVIVPLFILAPIIIAVSRFKELDKSLKIILYYLIISGSINLIAIIYTGSNLFLLHIYTAV